MSISFSQIPTANRVPAAFVEIDGTKALALQGAEPHRVLLIGLRLSTGTALEGSINAIGGEYDGDPLFDPKSQLAAMTRAFKRVNRTARVYAMPMDENAGGVLAAGSFLFAGTATADGTLRLRVGDIRTDVSIASGTAASAVATAAAAALTAKERLPVTSVTSVATVTLTARSKGLAGNDVTLEAESLPAGITVTTTQSASGATNPTIATAIAALDEVRYDTIVSAFTDATNMLALEAELARRWGPLVKQPGEVIAATRGSHATLTTYGDGRNSMHSSVMGSGLSPTPPWVWAAQVAARDAQRCDTQPNRPRNGLTLPDCEAPKLLDQFDAQQRNLLLYGGISTYKVDQSGRVMIERLITTYQANIASQADATYLDLGTLRNLASMYLEVLGVAAKYDDWLLGPDGTNVSPGVPLLTPRGFRGDMIAWYDSSVRRGRSKDAEGFAEELLIELGEDEDVDRMNVQLGPRLVNGKVTLAMKIAFQL